MLKSYIKLLVKQELLERKKVPGTRPEIYYHGTSCNNLQGILKNGLLANPENKIWDTDGTNKRSSISRRSLASLEGSYWTKNILTATSHVQDDGFKIINGKKYYCELIVIAQISPKESLPDEDNVVFTIDRVMTEAISDIFGTNLPKDKMIKFLPFILENKQIIDEITNFIIEHSHEFFQDKLTSQPPNKSLIKELIISWMDRIFAHSLKSKDGQKLFLTYLEKIFDNMSQQEAQNLLNQQIKKYENVSQFESNYSSILDKFTRYYKASRLDKTDNLNNIRYPKNLEYNNRSKILAIIEIFETHDISIESYGIIRYKDNNQDSMMNQSISKFVSDYKQFINSNFELK